MSEEKLGIFARFRRYFLAGILVTSPILITIYVTWIIITFIDAQVAGLLPDSIKFLITKFLSKPSFENFFSYNSFACDSEKPLFKISR